MNTADGSPGLCQGARKAHLFGVGAPKTGTHTIAQMFDSSVRAFHEAGAGKIIELITSPLGDDERKQSLVRFVRERDRVISAEVDSSQLNYFLLDILLDEYPNAKFLLTIRDCYTWLNSFINHSLRVSSAAPLWRRFRDLRFQADRLAHPAEEAALAQRGLYTLEGYLSYWTKHNSDVIAGVPGERLLIVRTSEIAVRAHEIADFAGLSRDLIRGDSLHAFRSNVDFRVLHELPVTHLDDMVSKCCGPLMSRFFPDINGLADVDI